MSSATMLTGLPSFYLARNYSDFIWESDLYDILPTILEQKGYSLFGLFGTKEMRDKMKGLFPSIRRNYLTKGIKLHQKKWTNKELLRLNKEYFDKEISSMNNPFFLMTWFNSRFDDNTSSTIKEFTDYLKKFPFYDDTLIIVTADHGYPDQRRGLTSDGPDLKKAGKPHDLIVTDDNICVPLSIKFPNNFPLNDSVDKLLAQKKSFSKPISQQLLFPTMLDVCQIKEVENSIINEIQSPKDEYIRSDARFIFQPNRITSVRNSKHKVIIDHEKNIYEFFDLIQDPKEISPTTLPKNIEEKLINYFTETEEKANSVWDKKISKKININDFSNLFINEKLKIIFFGRTSVIVPLINSIISKVDIAVDVFVWEENILNKLVKYFDNNKICFYSIDYKNKYANALIFLEDTFDVSLIEGLNKTKTENSVIVDIHFNTYKSKLKLVFKSRLNKFLGPIRRMSLRRELYKNDVMYLLSDIKYLFKRSISYMFKG